ncbi:MAG: TIGR01777 family oxidoreductase [Methylococcaceae bacterium]
MDILITGGTGFIGRRLCSVLKSGGHKLTVLSRNRTVALNRCGEDVSVMERLTEWTPDKSFDAVINLAGEPIMARRWSSTRKKVLWDSRVTLTDQLVHAMAMAKKKPTVFISGSAIGIYGDQGDRTINESVSGGAGFGHELCKHWEESALNAERLGIRVCLLRTGLVIGKQGGFLEKMLLPFKLCLGGPIGDGRQWMSWIHIDDHVALACFLLGNVSARGAFNATAPKPVTNSDFTTTLATCLHRPAVFPIPAWLLKLGAGKMSELLLGSQRVLPERALALGFSFTFETLEPAIRSVLPPS